MTWIFQRARRSRLFQCARRWRLFRWWLIIRRVRRTYNENLQRPLQLCGPRRFTEKMQWRKLFDLDPIYLVLSDKIASREYVAQRVGQNAVTRALVLKK